VFCHDRGGYRRCYSSFENYENCSGDYRSVRENCQMKELYLGNFHHIKHHTKRNSDFQKLVKTISAETLWNKNGHP
jgi:hypothetical protein